MERKIVLNFGSHSFAVVTLESKGEETKIKITTENEDGTVLVISRDSEEEFLRELQTTFMRYFI